MYIAKVVGTVVATRKSEELVGRKLLVVSPLEGRNYSADKFEVAVDSVGAGGGDVVLVVRGGQARNIADAGNAPIDAAIIGIIDSLEFSNTDKK